MKLQRNLLACLIAGMTATLMGAGAQAAITAPGDQKTDAKFLYGDALFRRGEFKRAKNVFIALYDMSQGDAKAQALKKIAACNRELGLPEGDGVPKK